jgi:hypothetical protein
MTTTPMSSQACCSDGGRNAAARDDQVERAAELAMDLGEDPAPGRVGEPPRDPAHPVEQASLPCRRDLAFDRRPEEVDDLGHEHERRRPVVADRLEDDPRVAAPDVQDVAPTLMA